MGIRQLLPGPVKRVLKPLYWRLRRPPTKFVIITRGRTGSNLLLSLLSSHPAVRHCGEIFGESQLQQEQVRMRILGEGSVPYLRRCLKRRGNEAAVGIKLLYYQIEEEYALKWGIGDLPQVLAFLRRSKGFKIIHLKRRNMLRTLVSMKFAAATQTYILFDEEKRPDSFQVELTADECEEQFDLVTQWEDEFDGMFCNHEVLEIYYEELAARMDYECDRVLDFLGVERRELYTSMVKQIVRPLPSVIKNYDDLKQEFAGTVWASFFET